MDDINAQIRAKIPGADTGIEIRHTLCDICTPQMHCGLDVYVKDGKVLKVEGTPDHPVNHGFLCTKGVNNRQYLYRKDRILTPLRRVGKRGEKQFVPISWEEAIEEISEKLLGYRDQYGVDSVAFFSGYGKWYRPMYRRFAHVFGTQNYGTESSCCFTSGLMAWQVATGMHVRADMGASDLFLGWGMNGYYSRYRMPDGVEKLEREAVLTYEEFLRLAALFAQCGIDTVRVTGGEPLVRKNVAQLVAGLKATPGIRRVTLTTNAVLLAEQLPALLDAGLDSVNISLDTLRPEVFRQITARDDFAAVQAGLQAALESGLPVKLNCVPQAGINEGELEQLAALAKDNALQVRFIEMMPIGYGAAMPCISGPELRARFARRWPELAPLSTAQEHALGDGPAVYYTVPGWQGSIGFIAAVHGKFCASCNRVRLTSQGFLRPCLASETGCDLRALLRGDADDAQLLTAIRETIWAKPREHHFNDSSMPATRGMYRIGG